MTSTELNLEKVLNELACEPALSGLTVRRYLAVYPHFAAEIIDFSLECQIVDDISSKPSAGAEAAGDRLLNGLLASLPQRKFVSNALAGIDIKVVEAETGIAGPLVDTLQKGQVRSDSIPDVIIRKLMAYAGVTRDRLLAGLAMQPGTNSALEFKSSGKPSASIPMAFSYFFDNSGLSDEEKQRTMAE